MILQNAVKITENGKITYLPSLHVHDFRTYTFADGRQYSVDGGKDYLKRSGFATDEIEEFNLSELSSIVEICAKTLWGTCGKDGKQPLTFLPIAELESEHVKAIYRDFVLKKQNLGLAQYIAITTRFEAITYYEAIHDFLRTVDGGNPYE